MSIMSEISNAVVRGRPQDEILQMVLEGIMRVTPAEETVLFMPDHDKGLLQAKMGFGQHAGAFCSDFSLRLSDEAGAVVGSLVDGKDKCLNGRQGASPDQIILKRLGVESVDIIALVLHERHWGVLVIGWASDRLTEQDKNLKTAHLFANQAALALGTAEKPAAADEQQETKRSRLLLDLD